MRIKIVISDMEINDDGGMWHRQTPVWEGEIDVMKEGTYVTKISLIADGQPHPICDIPFSMSRGYWMWVPPAAVIEEITEAEPPHNMIRVSDAAAVIWPEGKPE